MKKGNWKLILGTIINPLTDKKWDFFMDGVLLLKKSKNGDYKIQFIGEKSELLKKYPFLQKELMIQNNKSIINQMGSLIIPSFFDIHFHWVQDDCRVQGKDSLMSWLSKYAWPLEAKFEDRHFSKEKAKLFFERLKSTGTLGGAIYSSIHEHSLHHAMKYVLGDFIIGNVLMTINSPDYLVQTEKNAARIVEKLAKKYRARYAVTPRFAPATDPRTMRIGAKIAKKNKSFIQTHLSENKSEIDFVLSCYRKMKGFENVKNYSEIYHQCGILSKKTIMGHGIHLSPSELKLLAKTQTVIAHCPTSNAPFSEQGLNSGLFDFKKIEKYGVHWALASDIGGGPYLSMFDVMRSFVEQNRKKGIRGADYKKALYRATLAGAMALSLEKETGNLSVGKWANFITIKMPKRFLVNGKLKEKEMLLEKLIKSIGSREKLETLVETTFYKGNIVYKKC